MAIYIIAAIVLGIVVAVFIKIFSRRYPTQGERGKERKEFSTQEHIKASTKERTMSETRNNEQSENQSANKRIEILPFRLYHLKTLLITYLVWVLISTGLVVRIAYVNSLELGVSILAWFYIQIGPFVCLFFQPSWLIFAVFPILCVIGGLLIKWRLGCLFIVAGVTVWFCWGAVIMGLGIT